MQKEKLSTVLSDVERETRVFLQKLGALRDRYDEEPRSSGTKQSAALKRAALDLKNQLTRITQSKQW